MSIVNAEKKIIDKLVDECTETIEEVKLARITLAENENSHKLVLVQCILCYFGYFLQFMLVELLLILFIFSGT